MGQIKWKAGPKDGKSRDGRRDTVVCWVYYVFAKLILEEG